MKTPLVSVCIPTRNRPEQLRNAIQSVLDTATSEDFEIILRVDEDDGRTLRLLTILDFPLVRFITGPRFNGYASMGRFYSELDAAAKGLWIYYLDDDSMIEGTGWLEQLRAIPVQTFPSIQGVFVQPEFYQLNESLYPAGSCGVCAPVIPKGCWRAFADEIGDPPDDWLYTLLVLQEQWDIELLRGVTWNHQRTKEKNAAPTSI